MPINGIVEYLFESPPSCHMNFKNYLSSLSTTDRNHQREDQNLQQVQPTLHPRIDGTKSSQLELIGSSIVRMLQS